MKAPRKPKVDTLTPVKDLARQDRGKPPWRLSIPAAYSETGKRIQKLYWSYQAAREAAKEFKVNYEARKAGIETLSPAQTQEAITALELLHGSSISLIAAARLIAGAAKLIGSDIALIGKALSKGVKLLEMETYSPTFKAVAKEMIYVKEKIKKRRQSTLGQINYTLNRIERTCPDFFATPIGTLTGDSCREVLNKTFDLPIQMDKARLIVSGVFTLAVKRGWAISNVTRQIDALVYEEKEIYALSPNEVLSLLVSCRGNLISCLAPIAIMAFGGIRPEEMKRLTWDDVSFEHKVVTVRTQAAKTGGARHVTMNAAMLSWISIIPESSRVGSICPKGWRLLWQKVRSDAGWSKEKPWVKDALRHTFATYHAKLHENFALLQMEMGHASSDLLRTRYMNMAGVTKQMSQDFWAIRPS